MSPCFKCGARASCKHREADEPVRPVAVGPDPRTPKTGQFDLRKFNGNGYNFRPHDRAEMLQRAIAKMRESLGR